VARSVRSFVAGVRLMVTISWRADKVRSVAAAFTASGQYVVLPVRAVGLALITNGIVDGDRSRALAGVGVVVGASALNRLLAWASLNVRMRLREHTQLYLDTHLMELTAGIPGIEHHELPEFLDSMERLRSERGYLANPFNPLSWTLASLVQCALVMVLLAGVHPALALVPLLGLPAARAAAMAETRGIALADRQAEPRRVLRHLMDLATDVGPAKEVRIYGLAGELLARRSDLFDELEAERTAQSRRNLVESSLCWLVFAGAYAGALAWTVDAALAGSITVGAVVLVMTLGAQLNGQLSELAFNMAWFARSLRAVRRLVWFTEYADAVHESYEVRDPAPLPSVIRDGITLRGVSFTYPGSSRPVLHDLDLELPAGSTVAIVGENGSGKTTLVKLLARMYEPTQGAILVDGIDVRRFPVDEWRRKLAAGFQDFVSMQLLVRDSIGAGDVANVPTDDQLAGALERAVAGDLVAELHDGFDTQLGRQFDGVELSVGQWQKVALARAMLREEPLLLVLDEPTASLDAPTEHALFERFATAAHDVATSVGGVTVLISHRFSTVRMADLIVVLANGAIIEQGAHDELIAADGLYAELYRLQARAYRVH
jgi:ATP-binding cassette subfamily B protein